MPFRASIEGESVTASHQRPPREDRLRTDRVSPARELVLSGEPFDVTVSARTADGKPVAKDVSLFVLRRKVPKPDPVLAGVPVDPGRPPAPRARSPSRSIASTTDAETGEGTVRLTLEDGGVYVLRASAEDRFGQTVVSEGRGDALRRGGCDEAPLLRGLRHAARRGGRDAQAPLPARPPARPPHLRRRGDPRAPRGAAREGHERRPARRRPRALPQLRPERRGAGRPRAADGRGCRSGWSGS